MELFGLDISAGIMVLKVIGFILSLGFGVGIIVTALLKIQLMKKEADRRRNYFHVFQPDADNNPRLKRWEGISTHFESRNPAEWRIAIIDADTMLEDMITQMGFVGSTFGEKLKSIHPSQFRGLQDAWQVHKLRNEIAHGGPYFQLSEREAYQAFKTYEHLFYDNGYLG
jgi:hypothetical protein